MQTLQRIWQYLQHHRVASIALGHVCVLLVLATVLLTSGVGSSILHSFADSCPNGDQTYIVQSGDTLGIIAARYNTTVGDLATHNHIDNPNIIYVNQMICIPGQANNAPIKGTGNYFPYGQCTWWANERYHELTGIYVPWTTQSNAWQWTDRANDFGWRVSSSPTVGAIVDLQPWVQGAGPLGHVAVVEQILGNGDVLASNMNWGSHPEQVVNVEFTPTNGVTFLTFN